ncbi:SocA family protein [Patescibacteria group bacterium]|nr:SocA family protein [Patescibacteria group bacterium]MBU2579373.1 SocA family protein [Patescibacteria group bacterium]MCG2808911.1 SocA family protein [Candidatus Portnoybacteria bacterium]
MRISISKLKAILLYFCAHTNPRFLGKVKLMKLFYFLDFMHVKQYGSPVTYDDYVHLERGPIPSNIKNLVDNVDDDMDDAILSDTIKIETLEGQKIHRILPLRKFSKDDEKYFSENELDILQKVCIRFGNVNTRKIEDESHKESPWNSTELLDKIPYILAADDADCKVTKEEIKLLMDLIK